jgi:beta-lactamase class A
MRITRGLVLFLVLATAACRAGAGGFPELRDCHDEDLQAAVDQLISANANWTAAIHGREASVVVADVTDPKRPLVAWYNPERMFYAASLPKIAIILAVFVEVDAGRLELDDETRTQLIRTVKVSSNRDATALLNKVGIERVAEILQDPAHGKLYDPDYGGGLWVGKPYSKAPAWKRDPINHISHGSSAMAAARFYYGASTGILVDHKHLPLLEEIFGNPGVNHKFVKGLNGREREIFRKSGTWRTTHADSAVIVHPDGDAYLVVVIGEGPGGSEELAQFIRKVDDLMESRFQNRQSKRKSAP